MPALPPNRPGAFAPASGGPAAGLPGGTSPAGRPGETGPAGPGVPGWCPRPPVRPRAPAGPRPLPDPAAVRLCLIPDSAPPYDDETVAAMLPGPVAASASAGQGPSDARDPDAQGSPETRGSPHTPGTSAHREPPAPAGSADSRGLPPGWPSRFAQVLAETLAGSRPSRQLAPWTTERARDRIQRLGPQLSAGQQPRVRRVVTFRPTADAVEMTVVVGFGMRVHALAVRLERASGTAATAGQAARAGRWLCVAVEAA